MCGVSGKCGVVKGILLACKDEELFFFLSNKLSVVYTHFIVVELGKTKQSAAETNSPHRKQKLK